MTDDMLIERLGDCVEDFVFFIAEDAREEGEGSDRVVALPGGQCVWTNGVRAGQWDDAGKRRDLIDLLALVKGCDRQAAAKYCAGFLQMLDGGDAPAEPITDP